MVKKHSFVLTQKEFIVAIIIAIVGFLFSIPEWLQFLNGVPLIVGWLIYEAVFYGFLLGMAYFGLAALGKKITNPFQVLGLFLILFSLFIVIDSESAYVQQVTMGNMTGASNIFYQSEDGIVWSAWYDGIGIKDLFQARLLTFVITPFALASIGGFLVTKIEL